MSDIQPAPKYPLPKQEHIQRPSPPPLDFVEERAEPRMRDTSLFGQTVRKGRPFSVGAVLFSLLAVGVLLLTLSTGKTQGLPAAALPAAIAIALFLARRPAFELRITPEWIELLHEDKRWRYEDLQGVFRPRTQRQSAAYVFHPGGFFTIPEGTHPSPDEAVDFLETQPMRADDNPSVPDDLDRYLKSQEALYGPDRVWVFRPRLEFERSQHGLFGLAIGLASGFTGFAWIIYGFAQEPGWFALGMIAFIVGLVLGGVFWLVRANQGTHARNSVRSCLIVSPGGCALVQGPLRGELKWNEVRKITYNKRADFFTGKKGLLLHLDAAIVHIANIYHRPQSYIQELIADVWDDFHRA